MFSGTLLDEIIADQKKAFLARSPGVPRRIDLDRILSTDQVVVISGVRRCGKSTLLRQCAERLGEFRYINFDDERLLGFEVGDFAAMMLAFEKLRPGSIPLLIDEIQNVPKWEHFVRRLHDEGQKVILTGSNATMLSAELGTRLTGRHLRIELFPFGFDEFLAFTGVVLDFRTTPGRAELFARFDSFLNEGGFPEFLKYRDPEYLKRTYDDILYRDIVTRFAIREVESFKRLVHYLFANIARPATYRSLARATGIKTAMSVREYVSHLREAYLIFEISPFSFSVKKQYAGPKKYYPIDNGMRNTVSMRFSGDRGAMLENLVCLELMRRSLVTYYYRGTYECDFVIEKKGIPSQAIQVCWEFTPENHEREVGGLEEAMSECRIPSGLILTYNQDMVLEDGKIQIVPVWRWLIGQA